METKDCQKDSPLFFAPGEKPARDRLLGSKKTRESFSRVFLDGVQRVYRMPLS